MEEKLLEIIKEIREAKDAETKRTLMRTMGWLRESLYQITKDPRQKKLADNCYRVAQYGFKRFA
jgi:hypothetical protein